jgi:hypothetical protein
MGAHELVEGHDGFYVTQRNDDGSYELYRARLDHVGAFRRKWQAIKQALGEQADVIRKDN